MWKVLLLDDDSDLRNVLKEIFASVEVNVLALASVRELQGRKAEALQCDIALLDVNLGLDQPNGIDAAAWLRTEGYKGRIIFLTAHAAEYPQLRPQSEQLRAEVMEKTVAVDYLMASVTGLPL